MHSQQRVDVGLWLDRVLTFADNLLDRLETSFLDVLLKVRTKWIETRGNARKQEVHAVEVGLLLLIEKLSRQRR